MFVSVLAQRCGLNFAGDTGEGADTPAVVFPFHPEMRESQAHQYKFASPFPMAHIIPQAELSRARHQVRARKAAGKCLLGRNMRLMHDASPQQRQKWDELLNSCRRSGLEAVD